MSSSSLFMDDTISDEAYFILRSKEALKTNIYESKSWLLTAKTLYPQSFRVLFEIYQVDKVSRNAKEAGESFSNLFKSFNSENDLWPEVRSLITAILSENPTHDQLFLKNIFLAIPPGIQHNLLTVTSEGSENPIEHCKLVLLILHKFPHTLPIHGPRLVETLMTAEKHSQLSSINCYREILVGDLIPILLNNEQLELSDVILTRMLYKMVGFYIDYFMSKIFTSPNESVDLEESMRYANKQKTESNRKYEFTWEKMFNLLTLFGIKLNWELCSIFVFPWEKDIVWQDICAFSTMRINVIETTKAVKQFVLCLSVFFAYCLYQYISCLYSKSRNKRPLVLVEGFTLGYGKSGNAIYKKPKLDISIIRPVLSTANESTDVLQHFMFTVNCWDMIHSSDAWQKEFLKLKQQINLDPWLTIYMPDISLYHGKFEESADYVIQMGVMGNAIKRLSRYFCLKNHNLVIEHAIHVIRCLDTVPEMGSMSDELVKEGNRHLYFLPIEKSAVLQYAVKVLLEQLMKSLKYPLLDKNRLHCELIVLSQLNWPCEHKVAWKVLQQIKQYGSFTFQVFTKYIVTVELLEEFMYLLEDETNPVQLEITYLPLKQKDKDETRDNVKKFLRAQLKHWNDPVHLLITEFILTEEKFFPRVI